MTTILSTYSPFKFPLRPHPFDTPSLFGRRGWVMWPWPSHFTAPASRFQVVADGCGYLIDREGSRNYIIRLCMICKAFHVISEISLVITESFFNCFEANILSFLKTAYVSN